jgi:hypothetical protein
MEELCPVVNKNTKTRSNQRTMNNHWHQKTDKAPKNRCSDTFKNTKNSAPSQ